MKTPVFTCECGEHAWFAVSMGFVCFVDAKLATTFTPYKWHALRDHGNVYVARSSCFTYDLKSVTHKHYVHQAVLPLPSRLVVDHIDGNGLNNWRSNLRPLTSRANAQNQSKKGGCSSLYKGVSRRNGGWYAYIHVGRKQVGLGKFQEEAAAAAAYNRAAIAHYGPSASLNPVGA